MVHPEKIATPYPYTKDGLPRWQAPAPWPDPWVAIGAMAAVTQRIRFLTGIYVLPMRNPFQVAKAVGTAAVLSGDRVTLGVGVGWMREEFALLEQPFEQRGARTDEMIEVMRKLWRGGMVEHHGRFYDFPRLQMSPAPRLPIPILVGGVTDAALRRAGRIGDGWISDIHTTEELRGIVARIREHRREAGPREGRRRSSPPPATRSAWTATAASRRSASPTCRPCPGSSTAAPPKRWTRSSKDCGASPMT